jgi:hypothetical protein
MSQSLRLELTPPPPRQPRDQVYLWGHACRRCGWKDNLKEHTAGEGKKERRYYLCDLCETKIPGQ